MSVAPGRWSVGVGSVRAAALAVARRAWAACRRPGAGVVAVHLVALVALCLVALPNTQPLLLVGYDGAFYRVTAAQQKVWLDLTPGLASNPLQAFGNVFFCANTRYSPAFAL